ncbi:magnesium-translocating P-type ATPase [Comamonas granuli]|uniref:magnesium-translocating P-type ATPase n=1 Tax=Comamonas granuli TaxID=290309 RepID=UPI0005A78514|nr:magnesium-translocating P-type ATPase [Comamonas granuli]
MPVVRFRDVFATFLRVRRMGRHFRRRLLPESLPAAGAGRELPAPLGQALAASAASAPEALLARLGSRTAGLTEDEARTLRARVGPNEVGHEKPLPWWLHLWHCYRTPFSLLLSVLAAVSLLTDDLTGALTIGAMVLLSTLLRFWQEGKSNRAADALKHMVSNTATVLRPRAADGLAERAELPIRLLVPGDVIALSAGDMVPADCRVLTAKDLFLAQAAMTGESLPVEKFATQRDAAAASPLELENILFMGTNVVSGAATAVVLATGNGTCLGVLAGSVAVAERAPTAFQVGVNQVSWLLIRFMLVMVPLVFLLNGFTKGDWLQALLFALSVAVGLTPEMLPMIVTSTLAKGAVFLSRKKVIVKRLDAIQNFGAMDVLCTDKTGTLTQDKIFLARHVDAWGAESAEVLELAYLNSYYQTGLKNLLDVAVLEHAEVHRDLEPLHNFHKIDEIPFDFTRRRMSVIVAERAAGHRLITKGALDEVLAVCTQVRRGSATEPLAPDALERIRSVAAALNGEGLRVVAVAAKDAAPGQHTYGLADECGLTLIGYVAFLDPPKETTAPALQALAGHGVALKVLTGDNERVTAKICHEVGLESRGVLLGGEVEQMDGPALAEAVERHNVFARLTPAHKERIVRQLKANGHVVGFLGDGINDAPALRAADIGISVDSAVDIAKEAADLILLEKSLMVLDEGVVEGRRTFINMLKYIKMTASSNFGNVLSVLVASVFIPFLPMLPMHLLVQNLLYDISQIAIPFDHVDEGLLRAPQHWRPGDIGHFMLYFGPISSVFDLLTFALMWFVFGAQTPAQQTLFQSGWFTVGLLTQTLIVHMIRTPQWPFVQSRAAAPLLVMTGLIMAVGVFLPMGPLAGAFKLQPLPPLYFALLPLLLLGYLGLTQAMKGYYRRRWGWQ